MLQFEKIHFVENKFYELFINKVINPYNNSLYYFMHKFYIGVFIIPFFNIYLLCNILFNIIYDNKYSVNWKIYLYIRK